MTISHLNILISKKTKNIRNLLKNCTQSSDKSTNKSTNTSNTYDNNINKLPKWLIKDLFNESKLYSPKSNKLKKKNFIQNIKIGEKYQANVKILKN